QGAVESVEHHIWHGPLGIAPLAFAGHRDTSEPAHVTADKLGHMHPAHRSITDPKSIRGEGQMLAEARGRAEVEGVEGNCDDDRDREHPGILAVGKDAENERQWKGEPPHRTE